MWLAAAVAWRYVWYTVKLVLVVSAYVLAAVLFTLGRIAALRASVFVEDLAWPPLLAANATALNDTQLGKLNRGKTVQKPSSMTWCVCA